MFFFTFFCFFPKIMQFLSKIVSRGVPRNASKCLEIPVFDRFCLESPLAKTDLDFLEILRFQALFCRLGSCSEPIIFVFLAF